MRTQRITIQLRDDFPSLRYRRGDHIQGIPVLEAEEPVETPERYLYNVTIMVDKTPGSPNVHGSSSLRRHLWEAVARPGVFPNWGNRNLVVTVDQPVRID